MTKQTVNSKPKKVTSNVNPPKVQEPTPVKLAEDVKPQTTNNNVKRILQSKVIWVNLLSFIAVVVQEKYGFVFSEELQLQILTIINIALRFITHEKIAWGGIDGNSKENT